MRRLLLLGAGAVAFALIPLSAVGSVQAGPRQAGPGQAGPPPGTDQFPSGARINYTIDLPSSFTEEIELTSAGLPDAVVQRGPLTGGTISTEIVSMELQGTSPRLGRVVLQVGREFGLPPTLGQITNVQLDKDGNFVSGDSDFTVFFGLSAFQTPLGAIHARGETSVRVRARIFSLPPNKPLPTPGIATALDHFKCYQVKAKERFRSRAVSLDDQFEVEQAKVLKPVVLCAPVNKNREGIRQPLAHLKCYAIRDVSRTQKPQGREVEVKNQFGTQTWTVLQARTLCLPSLKRVVSKRTPRPAPPNGHPEKLVDHFKCYDVQAKKDFQPQTVSLNDQFEKERARVLKPVALCAPVSKNGQKTRDPLTHLACYAIQDVSRSPKSQGRVALVGNQFGTETLTILEPQTLCVPSRKLPPCSEYAERTKAALLAGNMRIGTLNEAIHIPFMRVAGSPCE